MSPLSEVPTSASSQDVHARCKVGHAKEIPSRPAIPAPIANTVVRNLDIVGVTNNVSVLVVARIPKVNTDGAGVDAFGRYRLPLTVALVGWVISVLSR